MEDRIGRKIAGGFELGEAGEGRLLDGGGEEDDDGAKVLDSLGSLQLLYQLFLVHIHTKLRNTTYRW